MLDVNVNTIVDIVDIVDIVVWGQESGLKKEGRSWCANISVWVIIILDYKVTRAFRAGNRIIWWSHYLLIYNTSSYRYLYFVTVYRECWLLSDKHKLSIIADFDTDLYPYLSTFCDNDKKVFRIRDFRVGTKFGPIGRKWDKSGTF